MYYNANFTLEQAQHIKVCCELNLKDSFDTLDGIYFDDVPEVYEQHKKVKQAYQSFRDELEKFIKLNEKRSF